MNNSLEIDECRADRLGKLGIVCWEEDCGFCGIEKILEAK